MAGPQYNHWDLRFLAVAGQVASWSKDPQAQVGALLVSPDRRAMSWGFNGFPVGFSDDDRLWRDDKNDRMVHAELNAILNARRDLAGWTLYVTKFPCHNCALAVVQAGLVRVVTRPQGGATSKWAASHAMSRDILTEGGVALVVIPNNTFEVKQ